MRKERRFDFFLAVTVTAALALLGAAVRYAVLRPQGNWHSALPGNGILDCWSSAFYLFLAAFVCLTAGLHYDDRYYD